MESFRLFVTIVFVISMLEVITSSKIVLDLDDRGGKRSDEGAFKRGDYYDDDSGSGDYDDAPDPGLQGDWKSQDRRGNSDGDYSEDKKEDIKGWNIKGLKNRDKIFHKQDFSLS